MNQQQKSKLLILIIAIMLLGIGLEVFQTGSSFLCAYSSSTNTDSNETIQSSTTHSLLTKNLFVMEGIRQNCGASYIKQSTRRICIRNSRLSFHILSLLTLLPFVLVCSDISTVCETFLQLLYSLIIIGYIHLSDGQKSKYSCTMNCAHNYFFMESISYAYA